MSINGVRQIIDIQNQIKNLNTEFDADELRLILYYNSEIKKFLLKNVTDEFTLKHINEIPDLNLKDFKKGFDYVGLLISIFSGRFDSFDDNKYNFGKAKEALEVIRDKYASLELMVKI